MNQLSNKQKGIIVIIGVIVITIVVYYISTLSQEYEYDNIENLQENILQIEEEEKITEEKSKEIVVHIAGEVIQEGIVVVNDGARIQDIINQAGGLTTQADLTQVNLAYKVKDGQKIIIPSIDETEEVEYITTENGDNVVQEDNNTESKGEERMININTATKEELMQLQGIGDSTAQKIINYRTENGEFNSIEDLKNVSGIGDAKFNSICSQITV